MNNQLSIKNAENTFLQLQNECKQLEIECNAINIIDKASLKIATQALSRLKAKIKEVEEIRVPLKAPALDVCRQIDALAKTLSSPMEVIFDKKRKEILLWNQQEEAKAIAEQNRINSIKSAISKYSAEAIDIFNKCNTLEGLNVARETYVLNFPGDETWFEFTPDAELMKVNLNDYCENRLIEIETPDQADEEVAEAIKEVIEDQVSRVGDNEIIQAEYLTPTKYRGLPRFRIVNENQVPRAWLSVDEAKIKEYQKKNKDNLSDGDVRFGVEFYIEKNVNIR